MLLAKHLLGRRVPVMLAEVHAPLARYYDTHLPVMLAEIHVPGTHTKSTSLFSGFATTGPSVSLWGCFFLLSVILFWAHARDLLV